MNHNHIMEQQRMKHEMELKVKELEYQLLLSDKLNEAKYLGLEEKLKHMEERNELKRQIDLEKMKGENAVLATKLEAEKERSKEAREKPYPYDCIPPWWNPTWGAWHSFTSFSFPANSILLNPHFYQVIQAWLGSPRNWALVYRATRDGFASTTFHSNCNNVGPTITIVKSTSNYLFGGYNPNNWTTSSTGYQSGGGSFIFTLTNAWNKPPTIFRWLKSHGPYDHQSYGPIFGGGHDIIIVNNANSNNSSCSNFPHSYQDTLGHGKSTFAGSNNFTVAEIEVFSLH